MPLNLERLASRLLCPRCHATDWQIAGRAGAQPTFATIRQRFARFGIGKREGLSCRSCGARYACEDGVLLLAEGSNDPEIAREREAARTTERDPALGGISCACGDLSSAEGPLKEALLALPWGDDSRYYLEPGYFSNVRSSVAGFDFVLRNLGATAGERLLDLGADLTWSTSLFARRGLECTAVDISHRLPIAHLFERNYSVSYDLVQADMTTAPFRDSTFDVVVGVDALHHSNNLQALAGNIARMLVPGGRLGLVEPYCQTEADKEAFGRAQIGAGISEHVYLLDEWHRAFATAGLVVRTHRVAESFAAVYEKPRRVMTPPPESRASLEDLFEGFYDARLAVLPDPPSRVRAGDVFDALVRVENHGRHTWCTNSHFLVRLTYHLYEAGLPRQGAGDGASARTGGASVAAAAARAAAAGLELVSWDNPRTALPAEIGPGDVVTMALQITAPSTQGDYVAEIDLLQEYVHWFAEKGTEPQRVRFTVV